MAIQTAAQLKAAFGAGKFPNVTNWEDLIDTIFSRGVGGCKIFNAEMNAYSNPWDNYTIPNDWFWNNRGDADNVGGVSQIKNLSFITSTITSPYSPISIDDFQTLINRRCRDIAYSSGPSGVNINSVQYDGAGYGDIIIIHNDGAFYYEQHTENGEVYVSWSPNTVGQYGDNYATDTRYYAPGQSNNEPTPKPQIVVIPVGCSVAFCRSNGGWQPIGNFTSYDYDALMQKVQDNPYNN